MWKYKQQHKFKIAQIRYRRILMILILEKSFNNVLVLQRVKSFLMSGSVGFNPFYLWLKIILQLQQQQQQQQQELLEPNTT